MQTFWISVGQDVAANLVTLVIVGGLVMAASFTRVAGLPRWPRRWMAPTKRVYRLDTPPPEGCTLVPTTPFRNPVRGDERQRLVDWYAQRMHTAPTNGEVMRLDGIQPWTLSAVDFYDFLSTNLTAFGSNWPSASWAQHWQSWWHWWGVFPLVQRVRGTTGMPQSGEEALMNQHLANPLAVSVLLQDCTGRWGIVVRSQDVAVASGQWATTVAGTVGRRDLADANPVRACASRETLEEIGLTLEAWHWDGLVVARQKMQPVALVSGRVARTWEELLPLMRTARDWHFENAAFYAVPPECLKALARQVRLTDAAAYHCHMHATPSASVRRIHLQRYRLTAP